MNSSATTITIIWNPVAEEGGTPVIDYTVYFYEGELFENESYEVAKANIEDLTYSMIGVIPGHRYTFLVKARNAYGMSDYSAPF